MRRYFWPLVRLSGFVLAVALVLAWIDYRVARASIVERLLGIGQRMAPFLDDIHGTEAPRELHVNGARMWVAAGHTPQQPALVRQWYAERYAGKGTATDLISHQLAALKVLPRGTDGMHQATFGDDRQGGMAAIDLGNHVTMQSLKQVLAQLASGKIGEVGHLRYLYYERTSDGGTRYLTIWTDDTFDLGKLLPDEASGDVPGRDIDGVPRYPGTVRVLSSDERGRSGQLAVFTGGGSPELAQAFYDARMRTLGWQADPHYSVAAADQGLRSTRWMNAQGREVVVDLSDDHDGQGVTVTTIALR